MIATNDVVIIASQGAGSASTGRHRYRVLPSFRFGLLFLFLLLFLLLLLRQFSSRAREEATTHLQRAVFFSFFFTEFYRVLPARTVTLIGFDLKKRRLWSRTASIGMRFHSFVLFFVLFFCRFRNQVWRIHSNELFSYSFFYFWIFFVFCCFVLHGPGSTFQKNTPTHPPSPPPPPPSPYSGRGRDIRQPRRPISDVETKTGRYRGRFHLGSQNIPPPYSHLVIFFLHFFF